MHKFSIKRVRTVINQMSNAPLFEQMGEDLDDDRVVHAQTLKQLAKALTSNDRFWTDQSDHHTGMILDVYGWEWFDKHNNDCIQSVQAEIDKSDIPSCIDDAWARVGIPNEFSGVDTKRWANNWFRMIGYDHGLGFDDRRSFELRFVEPWLVDGRFPCGWKGRPQRKPDLNNINNPWHGVTVEDLVGDGQLIVF